MIPESLEAQKRRVERVLLEGIPANTFRTPKDYAELCCFGSEAELLAEIAAAGEVCDVGSGHGGLTKVCYLMGIPTPIFPINPSAILPRVREQEIQQATYASLVALGYDDERIQEAQEHYDRLLEIALAHDLPFEDNRFGLVFDCLAATHYANTDSSPDAYRESLREMIRITRKGGGKIVIASHDGHAFNTDGEPGRKTFSDNPAPAEAILKEIIAEQGCSYELRWGELPGYPFQPLAVVITKPMVV